ESRLPHRTRSRPPPRPDPCDRPLLAEAGFILEIGMNLLLGMRRGDGVDLLDDDLLEEFLDLGVGLLMLGPGHQAAVIEAMQQVIDRLPAQAHAEFLLQDAAQVLAAEGADAILGGGPGLEAVSEPRHIRRGQAGRASGVGPLLEGRQAPLVVAADPGLNGAARASQGPGDRGGGMALLGQDDGLMTQPDPFLREGFGQSLKFFEAVMAMDKHRSSSWCDSDAQSILPNRHNPWNRSARIFRTWYQRAEESFAATEASFVIAPVQPHLSEASTPIGSSALLRRRVVNLTGADPDRCADATPDAHGTRISGPGTNQP